MTIQRTIRAVAVAGAMAGLVGLPSAAHAQIDSVELGPVMAAALGEIRQEFPFGRVVLDRTVIDTSKRLAPPLMSGREHTRPEDWARRERVETAPSELAAPECNTLRTQCRLQSDIVGVVAFADPQIWRDSARVIARYSQNFGEPPSRVRTTVVELSLTKSNGEWRVRRQRIRATG